MANSEYNLSVINGSALTLSLSGPAGATGATGATGAAGPNTVSTSTTTSLNGYIFGDGTTVGGATAAASAATANTLVLRNASGGASFGAINATSTITTTGDYATISTNGVGAYVSTFGADAFISTSGTNASISTSGSNADIFTSGENATISTSGYVANIYTTGYVANIYTTGYGAKIYTTGAYADISTTGYEATITTEGDFARINTFGSNAHIFTQGTNAHIQSRSTFKLFNGTSTTTLSHSPTTNRAIAFPNASGTVPVYTGTPATGQVLTASGTAGLTNWTSATSAATANTLVLRDASGGAAFEAITANSAIYTTGLSATIYTNGDDAAIRTFGAAATINTSGQYSRIYTSGANADISTNGVSASIYTSGASASIGTSGLNAAIYTNGANASIGTSGQYANLYTNGANAAIGTSGLNANIYTQGTNAHIQSRSTFKLFNGTNTTTLSHAPTTNNAIAFPNASGTVALVNLEQTFTGLQQFSTRPRSSAALTPTNTTELITLADGDSRYGATGLAGTSSISITNQITPQTIRSATLAVGLYHIRMVFLLDGTANTGTRHGYGFSGTATARFFRSRVSSPTYTQQTSIPMNLGIAESSTSAVVEGIISVTVAGTFSMQAAQNTSHPDVLSVGASNHMIITPCPKGSIS